MSSDKQQRTSPSRRKDASKASNSIITLQTSDDTCQPTTDIEASPKGYTGPSGGKKKMPSLRDGQEYFRKRLPPEFIDGQYKRHNVAVLACLYAIVIGLGPAWLCFGDEGSSLPTTRPKGVPTLRLPHNSTEFRAFAERTTWLDGEDVPSYHGQVVEIATHLDAPVNGSESEARPWLRQFSLADFSTRSFFTSIRAGLARQLKQHLESEHGGKTNADAAAEKKEGFASPLFALRLATSLYCLAVLAQMAVKIGLWPLVSYTMFTWCIITVRWMLAALLSGSATDTALHRFAFIAHELLRFPALVQSAVTLSIWWLVLVPLICAAMYFSKEGSIATFMKWNFSWFLINVHLLNVPLAFAEQGGTLEWAVAGFSGMRTLLHSNGDALSVVACRQLVPLDLWVGMTVALSYLAFYLAFIDGNGIHFYPILNPRIKWAFLSYLLIFVVYWGVWSHWSGVCFH
eukprot:Hpha_TRINITY_DN8514_c0_g2::TRINITY_DN8514_c0_g2_i1::g.146538::m.146538